MVNSSKTQILHYCFRHHIVWFPMTLIQYITIKPKISEVRDTKNQIITVYCLLCVCVCVCARACLVTQLCPIMWPWAVAHQAPLLMGFLRQEYWRVLPFSSSRGSSQPRDWTCVSSASCIAGRFFTCWAIYNLRQTTKPLPGLRAVSPAIKSRWWHYSITAQVLRFKELKKKKR